MRAPLLSDMRPTSSFPTAMMDSSDLELHIDSSISGGTPRSSGGGFPNPVPAMPPREAVALLALTDQQQQDQDPDVTSSLVIIKPNLKFMSNSERGKYYRRKRKLYAAELSASVSKLRRQVETLVTTQQLRQELAVSHTQTPLGSYAKLVREYCAQFKFGTPVHTTTTTPGFGGIYGSTGATGQPARVATATSEQRSFLRAAMVEQVGFGEFCGIELLLDQWERYSMYHAVLRFELKSLEVVSLSSPLVREIDDYTNGNEEPVPPVIVVRADLHVRYSLETIKQVFPHLMDDHALVQELIGLEVTYPCVNHFYFTADGKIERYNPEVDFMAALTAKIRRITGVAHVLNRALIAKDHMIGMLEDEFDRALSISQVQEEPEIIATAAPSVMSYDVTTSYGTGSSFSATAADKRDPTGMSAKPASRFDLEFILS